MTAPHSTDRGKSRATMSSTHTLPQYIIQMHSIFEASKVGHSFSNSNRRNEWNFIIWNMKNERSTAYSSQPASLQFTSLSSQALVVDMLLCTLYKHQAGKVEFMNLREVHWGGTRVHINIIFHLSWPDSKKWQCSIFDLWGQNHPSPEQIMVR